MKALTTLFAVLALGALSLHAEDAKKGDAKPKMDPEAAFKKKDANGDGKLSKEEFTKGAPADKADAMAKRFAAMDKDKDGNLTLEEYKAGMAAAGKKKAPK
jgi:Ca2+-binding EF-hand superfamily protein